MYVPISFADWFGIIFDHFKDKSTRSILLVKLNPSLFDRLIRTARQDMKNLDREHGLTRESVFWSELRSETQETCVTLTI